MLKSTFIFIKEKWLIINEECYFGLYVALLRFHKMFDDDECLKLYGMLKQVL